MCILFLCIYRPNTSPSSIWIALLYCTSRSTRECTVLRQVSCTSRVFQFYHLLKDVILQLYDEMKLQYSNALWTHIKLNSLRISTTIQAFGCDHRKGNIFLQLQWKGLGLMYETENVFCSLPWIPILSLFYPSSQEDRITEKCNKNVNLTNRQMK
jgi:hypothetical protein